MFKNFFNIAKDNSVKDNSVKDNQQCLFVFYNINQDAQDKYWNYELPNDWWWVGSGTTQPLVGKRQNTSYIQEEQFNGSIETKEEMKNYLESFFTNLLDKNIILKFTIRESYLPLPI
jgi:hypothetical protein